MYHNLLESMLHELKKQEIQFDKIVEFNNGWMVEQNSTVPKWHITVYRSKDKLFDFGTSAFYTGDPIYTRHNITINEIIQEIKELQEEKYMDDEMIKYEINRSADMEYEERI